MSNNHFKITVPITKCYLRKTADGQEKYVVEGMASGTDLDLTGERMAESAIKSMAKSLETHPVLFKSEHHDDWDAEFGEVTALYATPEHRLMMEAELDPDHYRTKTLVKALNGGKSLGLSIGGQVIDSSKEWLSDVGRMVKTYKDILLDEISVTGSPAYASTWLTTITKSVNDWKDTPMPKEIEQTDQPEQKEEEVAKTDAKSEETTTETTTEVKPATEPKTDVTTEVVQEPVKPTETITNFDITHTEGDAPKVETTTTTETAAVPDAAGQKTDEASTAKSDSPAQATNDTTEDVAKAQYLGEYAEASAASSVITDMVYDLSWQVFSTIADDEMDAATQISTVDAMLTEFHAIALKVATALIESDAASDAAEAAKSAKSRLDKTEEHHAEELTKSLSDKDGELAEVAKKLETLTTERDAAIEKSQTLEEKEATTRKRQNVLLFSKFSEPEKPEDQPAEEGTTLKAWMASTVNDTKFVTD